MIAIQKLRAILTASERREAVVLSGLMVIGMMLEMLGVGMLFPIMVIMGQDNLGERHPVIRPALEFLGNPTQSQLVVAAMMMLVGIYLIKNLLLAFIAWRQARFIAGTQAQLMQRIFTAYMYQPYTFHLQRNSSRLASNISEVGVATSAIQGGMAMLGDGLALLGIFSMLLLAEPLGVMILSVGLGAAVWGFNFVTRSRVSGWGVARQYHDRLRGLHMSQGLGGVKDAKLLGREHNFLRQFKLHSTQSARVAGSQTILLQLPRLWLELLAVTGLAILVLSMIGQGIGVDRIVPTLALFAAAAFRLIPAINRMLAGVQSLRFSLPSIDLLYEEAKLVVADAGAHQERTVTPLLFKTGIRLDNVEFIYPNALSPALSGVSISIKKGQSVGFIGASGSGKSTLVDIILGLLPPSNGQIKVDGQDIQMNLRTWQNQIGYVPQSIYLTDDSIKCNVAFGLPSEEIDDVAVQRAIKDAQLEEFIASLPNGLETIVGERGVRLSGGQRQRIGIARALYHNPSVLVLDEATSALDTATERGVMEAVMALQGSKTILIVAHRLSTVEHCDRLYRLEKARIVAEGTPAEMLITNKAPTSA